MADWMPLIMFLGICMILLAGYPVAFSLAGGSLLFALIGIATNTFDPSFLEALPNRLYGVMINDTLIAVPLFVFMGVMLERSKIAEDLLDSMSVLFSRIRGGLGISVALVGMLLAASTGIVGATVVTMGLLSLPTMLKRGYSPELSTGIIAASGTLGQIIPPSIVLVLLGDVLSSAYSAAQLEMGNYSPDTVSVGDLFVGALIPGFMLVAGYIIWVWLVATFKPDSAPRPQDNSSAEAFNVLQFAGALFPALLLILAVLGSILYGIATTTEAASVGAAGATLLAIAKRQLSFARLKDVVEESTRVTAMVFMILVAAALFSLVFRGFGGDDLVRELLTDMPGGVAGAMIAVMLVMFVLGFVLDFIEITFVVVPIVGPVLLMMGVDPIWLGIMIAVNLQTSFLTPPFGFALFYLRGVAPPSITTGQIYRGVIPFIVIQLTLLLLLALFPSIVTWLPNKIYG
jgi:tripartite ATP-independent transporter DctM subunit